MYRPSRRQFLKLLAAGGGVATVAGGLGAFGLPPSEATSSFDWKRFKGTNLRFMVSDSFDWTVFAAKRLPEFETLTGIKVNWETFHEGPFRQQLPLRLRTAPESVDGFETLTSWDGLAFEKAGWYEPLDKYIHSDDLTSPGYDIADFFPELLKLQILKGSLMAIPMWPEVQLLFYNTEAFQQRHGNVPTNFDEWLSVAQMMTDKPKEFYGYVTRGNGRGAVYSFSPILFGFGGRWLDERGRPALNSQAAIKAFEFYGKILRQSGPPNIAGLSSDDAAALFQGGRAAMLTEADDFHVFFLDPSQSKIADKVSFAPLPAGPAGSHSSLISWGLSICSKSRHKEAVWYLIQYLTNKVNMTLAVQTKLPVARRSVWNSAFFRSSQPKAWVDAVEKEIPSAVANGPNPLVIPVPEVRDAIGNALVSVLQGRDATQAANEAQGQVLRILGM